jgi:hypothetical protein
MHDRMGSGPTPRPVTAFPHEVEVNDARKPDDGSGTPRPVLSLVTDPSSDLAHVEHAFFAQGMAEEQAALDQYASFSGLVRRRASALGHRYRRALLIGGATAVLLLAIAGLHRMGSRDQGRAVAQTPDSIPVAVAPVAASPAPAAPNPGTAQAPVAPVNPGIAAPAAEPVAATPSPTPLAAAEPAAAPPSPTPLAAAEPAAAPPSPTPLAAAEPAAAVAAAPALPPPPAAAVVVPAPAQPSTPPGLAAKPAEVAPTPEGARAPAEEAAAHPTATPSASQTVEACREALKKRDAKAVTASCEAALDADASLARPLLGFAKAQFERGRSTLAATWARKVLQIDDSLADAYLILGAAEQEARRPSAARAAYQRYLELAPRGAYANDVRSSLQSL